MTEEKRALFNQAIADLVEKHDLAGISALFITDTEYCVLEVFEPESPSKNKIQFATGALLAVVEYNFGLNNLTKITTEII
jgi:hypothetical protein